MRAYTTGPALRSSPLRLTTEVTGGKAKSVQLPLRRARRSAPPADARHRATLTPAQLGKVGMHTLSTAVRGRRGAAKTVSLKLATAPARPSSPPSAGARRRAPGCACASTRAPRWPGCPSSVPAALLPQQSAKRRVVGFIRLYVAGSAKPVRYPPGPAGPRRARR